MGTIFSLMVHEVCLFNESKAFWATPTQASIFHAEQKVGLEQFLILRPTSHAISLHPYRLHATHFGSPFRSPTPR
jgi:hypothetical protein